jgi:hypothetical protein
MERPKGSKEMLHDLICLQTHQINVANDKGAIKATVSPIKKNNGDGIGKEPLAISGKPAD